MLEHGVQLDQSTNWKRPRNLGLVFALVLTAAVYVPSLSAYFKADDWGVMLRSIQGPSPWDCRGWFCRPLFLVAFKGAYGLFGLNAPLWHAAALLLHLANVALLYWFIRRIRLSRLAATLGATLFGVCSTHPEAVTWLCACSGVMAAFFCLVAAHIGISRSIPAFPRGLLCAAVWMAGLISKEEAAGFIAVLPFLPLFAAGKRDSRELKWWFASCLGFVAVLLVFQRWEVSCQQTLGNPRAQIGLTNIRLAASFALQAIHCPMCLAATGSFWGAALLATVPVVVWLRRPDLRLGLLLTFGPSLVIGTCLGGMGASDRYYYIPTIGVAVLVALVLESIRSRPVGPTCGSWLVLGAFVLVLAEPPSERIALLTIAVLALWFWIDSQPAAQQEGACLWTVGSFMLLQGAELAAAYLGLGYVPYWVWMVAPIALTGLSSIHPAGRLALAPTYLCACAVFWPDMYMYTCYLAAISATELFRTRFATSLKLSGSVLTHIHSLRPCRVYVLAGIIITASATGALFDNLERSAEGRRTRALALHEARILRTLPANSTIHIVDAGGIGTGDTRAHNIVAILIAKRPDLRVEVLNGSRGERPGPLDRPWIECTGKNPPVLHE